LASSRQSSTESPSAYSRTPTISHIFGIIPSELKGTCHWARQLPAQRRRSQAPNYIIANIAASAADDALKAEQPALKAGKRSAAYFPLAADGLVSDPVMVPPRAVAPAPSRKRAARETGEEGEQDRKKEEGC
jgi:cell division septation protein DedD